MIDERSLTLVAHALHDSVEYARIERGGPPLSLAQQIHSTLLRVSSKNKTLSASPTPSNPSTSAPFARDPDEQILISYRATPDDLARLQALVKAFEGTHNFHNYTLAREFGDRSAQRHMIKVEVRSISCGLENGGVFGP